MVGDHYESEIEPIIGVDLTIKNKKVKKVKMQCNACGHIEYTLTCTKCNGGMFKYVNRIGK